MTDTFKPLLQYLPPHEGLLPKWLLLVAVVSMANSITAYRQEAQSRRVYTTAGPQVTRLSGRTFGTWTFLSGVVRLYAAYNITNPQIYDLAVWTYGLALAHFTAEWLIFSMSDLSPGFISPLVVASSSLTWMLTQRSWYTAGTSL